MEVADELAWNHKVTDLRDKREFRRKASDAERRIVSRIFNEVECLALAASYEILPISPGHYRVRGHALASIEQVCGVTLDPLEQQIQEAFDVEFRTGLWRGKDQDLDFDATADDDPEPIEHGEIRMGRYICELVASAIDPFPRAPEAELDQTEVGGGVERGNPFAALAKLKGDL